MRSKDGALGNHLEYIQCCVVSALDFESEWLITNHVYLFESDAVITFLT